MRIRLSYGLGGLEVDVPHDAAVVYPRDADPVTDPGAEVRRVLRAPVAGPRCATWSAAARRSPSRSATAPARSPGRS